MLLLLLNSDANKWGYVFVNYGSHIQGVPTQTVIFHFALAGRNMQASLGLKVIWESWIVDFLLMTLKFGEK